MLNAMSNIPPKETNRSVAQGAAKEDWLVGFGAGSVGFPFVIGVYFRRVCPHGLLFILFSFLGRFPILHSRRL